MLIVKGYQDRSDQSQAEDLKESSAKVLLRNLQSSKYYRWATIGINSFSFEVSNARYRNTLELAVKLTHENGPIV